MHKNRIIIGVLIACVSGYCFAATHYVVMCNSNNAQDPYTNWATAGTNIIDVVNAAMTNTEPRMVWVSNGTYYLTNQVMITNALTLQSVNGRDVTIADGYNYAGKPVTNRCFYLSASGAVLDGFTLTNGYGIANYGNGGGVHANAGTAVQNCRIIGCVASNRSGTTYSYGCGAYVLGVITNCEVIGNIGYHTDGGGINVASGGVVANCIVASNILHPLPNYEAHGGGIAASDTSLVSNCKIYGNTSVNAGGSTFFGGGVTLANGATLRNSLVYNNPADKGGGVCVYYSYGRIQNCTIVSNIGSSAGGGIWILTASTKTTYVENVVSYFNTNASSSNIYIFTTAGYTGSCYILNSCIAPTNAFKTSGIEGYYYTNNIESNPQFVGKDAGNWHLTRDSPCVNAGMNQAWMDGAVDLDGHGRIDKFSGVVDIGCYEYLSGGVIITAW